MLTSAPELRRPHGLSRRSLLVIMVTFSGIFWSHLMSFLFFSIFLGGQTFFRSVNLELFGCYCCMGLHYPFLLFWYLLLTHLLLRYPRLLFLIHHFWFINNLKKGALFVIALVLHLLCLRSLLHPSSFSLYIDDLPIALRRGKGTCTQHQIARFVSYDRIFSCLCSFAYALSSFYSFLLSASFSFT